jgi:hypothetical protein
LTVTEEKTPNSNTAVAKVTIHTGSQVSSIHTVVLLDLATYFLQVRLGSVFHEKFSAEIYLDMLQTLGCYDDILDDYLVVGIYLRKCARQINQT